MYVCVGRGRGGCVGIGREGGGGGGMVHLAVWFDANFRSVRNVGSFAVSGGQDLIIETHSCPS